VVHFTVLRTATTITTTVSFENEPIYCEIVDIFANPIASSYSGATLTLMDIATFVEEENVQQEIPISFMLAQNFPNPFNAVTMIGFTLPEAGSILLSIYDLNGQMIRTIARGNYQPGRYKMVWDGCDDSGVIVASGIYLYSLKMTDRELTENRRMLLIR
ncbi:MAG: FlgD immunoglobulin-like domain containing protein, partial [Patescibacteria group bacterium]